MSINATAMCIWRRRFFRVRVEGLSNKFKVRSEAELHLASRLALLPAAAQEGDEPAQRTAEATRRKLNEVRLRIAP